MKLQPRSRSCLCDVVTLSTRLTGKMLRQNFYGNKPIEPGIARSVDLAHAASANRRNGAGSKRHVPGTIYETFLGATR
jgi:hypothetical protein